jgi:hypothetical protein
MFLVLLSCSEAQNSDWEQVKSLPADTPISVRVALAGHPWVPRLRCSFVRADDEQLVCDAGQHRLTSGTPEQRCRRATIREVRVERPDTNAMTGAAIGAGAGVAVGAWRTSGDAKKRSFGAMAGGAVGGIIGWFFGKDFGPMHDKVIYRP